MLRRFSPWALLVVGSLMALIAGATVLAAWWLDSSRTATVAYAVPGELLGIELRVQSGNVTIVGGSRSGVSVSRSDHSVYGHGPREQRRVRLGNLRLVSSCPVLVLGSCASNYRIEVPDNVSISVRAEHGTVRLEGYQGLANITTNAGSISADAPGQVCSNRVQKDQLPVSGVADRTALKPTLVLLSRDTKRSGQATGREVGHFSDLSSQSRVRRLLSGRLAT